MPHVRALAATDFYPEGADREWPAARVAMFEGQVYDVPDDETERLVADGLIEVVAEAVDEPTEDEEPAEKPKRRKAAE